MYVGKSYRDGARMIVVLYENIALRNICCDELNSSITDNRHRQKYIF